MKVVTTKTTDITEQVKLLQDFFEMHYYDDLVYALQKGRQNIIVDFHQLAMFNIDLAQELLDNPLDMFKTAQLALEKLNLQGDMTKFFVRFFNLPASQHINIREIRSNHIGKLVEFTAVVRQKTDVRPQATTAKFECPSCGNIMNIVQTEQKFREPPGCGCGRKNGFHLMEKELVDVQKLVLEEATDELDGGEQPKRFNLLLRHDLVSPISEKKTNPGSKILVVGVVNEIPISSQQGVKTVDFDLMLEGNYIEPVQEEFSSLSISPEQEKEIIEFSKSENPFKRIVKSLAPTIYGHERIKEALILQLLGGVMKPRSDGVKTRGDIHILLIGDPGAAKSQLLKRVTVIAPKSRFVSGKGASGAGLTAAVVRDEFLRGWALEAGALVLANQGIACIDELDKMSDDDRSAMHEALEQQTITISKANIQATLRSETTVLAAANPKFGRFNPFDDLGKQINLPPALISRFDLLFPIRDVPDKDKDERIASFILKLHQDITLADNVELSTNFIKLYIAYAKRKIKPKLSNEALEEIRTYYVKLRSSGSEGEGGIKSVPITARQLEALVRLTEASAKTRLSGVATVDDAKKAIELLHYTLSQIGMDPDTGRIDIDRITTGVTSSQRNHIVVVREAINKLANEFKQIPEEEIIKYCESKGLEETKIEEVLQKLNRTGDIFQPKRGFYSKG
ncbi:minichromosome maintenance protein MCM [Candidatus Woesearchaeota archaeon]|nr:minichromosome maintenance protein MCM [Candidatus Woesearchaeota archaeon]